MRVCARERYTDQPTRGVDQMMDHCWLTAGQILTQHWAIIASLLGGSRYVICITVCQKTQGI